MRTYTSCGETKPLDAFPRYAGKLYYRRCCKACRKAREHAGLPRASSRFAPAPPGMRVCRERGETKPLDGGFVRIKQGGFYGRCKACRAAERRARYRDDPAFRTAQLASALSERGA